MSLSLRRGFFAVFIVSAFMVLSCLSYWQVQRLAWKEDMLASIDAAIAQDPYAKTLDLQQAALYQKGTITGRYVPQSDLTIGPVKYKDQAGSYVYSLFQTECCALWVRRGWVRDGGSVPPVSDAPTSLAGMVLDAPQPHWSHARNFPEQDIWYWPDIHAMSQRVGYSQEPLIPFLLHREGENPQTDTPDLIITPAFITMPNNNHLSYAVFWGAMALIVLILGGIRLRQL